MNTLPEAQTHPVVLVVDDEPEILVALADLLESAYSVLTASSGQEGLALLRLNPDVAVIISDQRMPGMTGDVFLAQARDVSAAGAILLTGYADIAAVEAALNRGQISFFAYKPWDDETLLSMVGQAAERYRLENELARERLLLRGLLDNLPFGLAFKDQDGCFIRLNQQMAQCFGRSVAETIGHKEEDLLDGPRLESLRQAQRELADSGRDQQVIQLPGEDGQLRWHDLTRVRLDSLRGEPAQVASILPDYSILIDRDVTDLLNLEQRLRQAQKMQAIGTLAGGIAHDFNNLLTAIQGSLELVQDLEPPKEASVSRLYQNAMDAARRGGVLTRKLLDFSRPRHLVCQRVDIRAIMEDLQGFMKRGKVPEDVRRMLDAELEGNSRFSSVDFVMPDEALPPVWTDATQLELAVFSLCINALDAQPEGGSTSVTVRQVARLLGRPVGRDHAGAWVVVQVRDRGVGMTEEMRARIFDPFFTTKDVGRGTGLGLSMIYGFISHCGGEVRVESTPGGGTSVELWFPAMDAELAEAMPAQQVEPVQPVVRVAPVAVTGQTVLVVDDEPGVRAVTSGFLQRAGYAVVQSASGAEALEAVAARSDIALVVMDVMMPGMNGGEAARRIHQLRADLPVLFVTGYSDIGLLPEDVAVLHKPYTRAALLEGVQAMLVA